jgi:hypothetical protein
VLLAAGCLTLLTLTLMPSGGQERMPTASAIVFADQPGPSDQQLLRRAAVAARHPVPPPPPPPPPSIQQIITGAFAPLGESAVGWALQIAFCESTDNPNAVNTDSNAQGLFQFLPSTWVGTPYASQSPFDPTANAAAAAWLLQTYGPSQWECQA